MNTSFSIMFRLFVIFSAIHFAHLLPQLQAEKPRSNPDLLMPEGANGIPTHPIMNPCSAKPCGNCETCVINPPNNCEICPKYRCILDLDCIQTTARPLTCTDFFPACLPPCERCLIEDGKPVCQGNN